MNKMKNILTFFALVTIFTFTNCNGQTNKNTANTKIVHLTKAQFLTKVFDYTKSKQWKYQGSKPCIVDFYATWCGPCKMVAPILDELSKEYDGKIIIYKVDTQVEQELAGELGIQSIPTILFCPLKGEPKVSMGAQPKTAFVQTINEVLLKN
jgi:thioredoxin